MDAPVFKAIQPEVSIFVCFCFPLWAFFLLCVTEMRNLGFLNLSKPSHASASCLHPPPEHFPLHFHQSNRSVAVVKSNCTSRRITPAPLKGFCQAANGKIRLRCSVTMNFHLRLIDFGPCFVEQTTRLSHDISSWLHNLLNTTAELPQKCSTTKAGFLN